MFRVEYMAKTTRSRQRYRKHNKNNMGYKGSLLAKNKLDQKLLSIFLW